MTVRIEDPPLQSTEELLARVLTIVVAEESRALFLCPAGTGETVVQRLRVMISRRRKDMASKGKRAKHFRLRSTIHRETHDGIRYDACVLWRVQDDVSIMREDLERMLSNG